MKKVYVEKRSRKTVTGVKKNVYECRKQFNQQTINNRNISVEFTEI